MIQRVNNISSQTFRGVWGDVQNNQGKPEVRFYPFIDDTEEQIQKEVASKLGKVEPHTPKLWWLDKAQQLKVIVTEPLKITKADFEKLNRGFLSDSLAKMLLK